jgi:DNA repair exonuclease SbcCD ATPase subunit
MRIIEAAREKEELDGTIARFRGLYTDGYLRRLCRENAEMSRELGDVKREIRALNRAIRMKKAQIEDFLSQDLTVEIARQEQRIADLENQLNELRDEENSSNENMGAPHSNDPECGRLEDHLMKMQARAKAVDAAKRERLAYLEDETPDYDPPPPFERMRVKVDAEMERKSRRGVRINEELPMEEMMQKNREELARTQRELHPHITQRQIAAARSCPVIDFGKRRADSEPTPTIGVSRMHQD